MSTFSIICRERKPGPFPAGRRCTHVDENQVRCITLLSRFDPGPDCFIHSAPAKATAHEQRVSFRELMSDAA